MNESKSRSKKEGTEWITNIEVVIKTDIWKYQFGKKENFLKISVGLPAYVTPLRKILEEGIELSGLGFRKFITFESNILFALRCMIDIGLQGASWIKIKNYQLRKKEEQESHCQIEIDVNVDDVIPLDPNISEWSTIAPLRILSFDIECAGKDGHFPLAQNDPVILISNYVTIQGKDLPIIKNVFVLGSCAPISGVDVHCFKDEKEMLKEWRNFFVSVDPDIVTGYNFMNFDLPYLFERAKTLQIPSFSQIGRIKGKSQKIQTSSFRSKQYGARESKDILIDGRVQIDVMVAIQREHKLSSFSLNAVSAHFLGDQKEKVHHSVITQLFNGSEIDRRRLAVYCLKDAYLPQQILDKLMIIINYIEMARVTGIPLAFILERGQQVRVVSQILRKARQKEFCVMTPVVKENTNWAGAKVFDPKAGYYKEAVATLDFASLYPSIMIAHNLCYTTLLKKEDIQKMKKEDYFQTPYGAYFVKPSVQKGFLPEILVELLQARKIAKKDYAIEKDPQKKNVLNGRQLALKISANSVYGFTGFQMGSLPCLEISASVTSIGREMILKTKELVEEKYSIKNGYSHNATVLYGDTDSVMVKFGTMEVSEAMKLGKEAADYVSEHFIQPITLQFEKVYCPYLLMKKKRYAGLKWTNPDKYEKLDTVGLETVRRDNCELVRHLITKVLQLILVKKSVQEAIDYTKSTISDLLMGRLDISMLIITKSISKKVDDYKNRQTHTELALKMIKRDPLTAPHLGDRVPYVIIKATQGAKIYEKSEDPIYVLENNIPIDTKFYLERQLSKPLKRVFKPLLQDPEKELLQGPHTRNIFVPTPTIGGILKFTKKQATCASCKGALKDGEKNICIQCKKDGKEKEIYQEILNDRNHYENIYSRVWTQCQRCQGSLHQDILCSNRDCPVFYMRKKVQKDLKESQEKLDQFVDVQDW